jgi:tetratricopeptide (TPR) repeat protein
MRTVLITAMALLGAGRAAAADKPVIAPPPAWVKPVAIPADTAPPDAAAIRFLLSDQQLRFGADGNSAYFETAIRIQTPEGLAAMGTSTIPWKPETQTLTVHKLHILRGTKVIDVLADGHDYTVLRRENNLEMAMLDGTLTATVQIEGLQIGDILDFAATVDDHDPVTKGHGERIVAGGPKFPISVAHTSALWPAAAKMHWRAVDQPAPVVENHDKDGVTMVATAVQPLVQPKFAPRRYQLGRQLEFSDFASWGDLSALFAPLYAQAATIKPGSPLATEVATIRAASSDPKMQAGAALALVQDKVRYLYLGMNDGALVPAAADVTWSRRFGDCKGKTALLLGLLHDLGIAAEPALVSSANGDGLPERLPTLEIFDHVIVRASIAGKTYWLDGTRLGDRGLDSLQMPGFGWALPLRTGGAALERLVQVPRAEPDVITSLRLDASAGIAKLAPAHAETLFSGDSATMLRRQLDNLPADGLDRGMMNYWRKQYNFITPATVSRTFDAATGQLRLVMDGTAKMEWGDPSDSPRGYEFDGASLGWRADFTRDAGPHRDAPFAVEFPSFAQSTETIILPDHGSGFTIEGKNIDETVAGLAFHRATRIDKGVATMTVSQNAIAAEFPAAAAPAAAERLRALSKTSVYVNMPERDAQTSAGTKAALATESKTAADFMARADILMRQNDGKGALEEIERAIAIDPKAAGPYAARAYIEARANNLVAARADVARAKALDPDNFSAAVVETMFRADDMRRTGKSDDAQAIIATTTKLLATAPDNAIMLWARALAYHAIGSDDLALADTARAVAIQPNIWDAHVLRANILRGRGDRKAAGAEADALIKANPDNPDALIYAGAILCGTDRCEEGLRALDKSIAIKPSLYAYLNRATKRPASDIAGRSADLQAGLKLEPDNVEALTELGRLQVDTGDFTAATKTLEKLRSRAPDNPHVLTQLAVAQGRSGNIAAAQDNFAIVRKQAGNDPKQLNALCWNQATSGLNYEAALTDCQAARALAPGDAEIADSMAFVLLRLKRYDEAIATYGAALQIAPTQSASLYGRSLAETAQGMTKAAGEDRAAALKISPGIAKRFEAWGVGG